MARELQASGSVRGREQGDARAKQDGDRRDLDGIDEADVKKGSEELASAKKPNVFAASGLQRLHPIGA